MRRRAWGGILLSPMYCIAQMDVRDRSGKGGIPLSPSLTWLSDMMSLAVCLDGCSWRKSSGGSVDAGAGVVVVAMGSRMGDEWYGAELRADGVLEKGS